MTEIHTIPKERRRRSQIDWGGGRVIPRIKNLYNNLPYPTVSISAGIKSAIPV
jgi:hypothetical protein